MLCIFCRFFRLLSLFDAKCYNTIKNTRYTGRRMKIGMFIYNSYSQYNETPTALYRPMLSIITFFCKDNSQQKQRPYTSQLLSIYTLYFLEYPEGEIGESLAEGEWKDESERAEREEKVSMILREYEQVVVDSGDARVTPLQAGTEPGWTFPQSVFFTATVLTTIGLYSLQYYRECCM